MNLKNVHSLKCELLTSHVSLMLVIWAGVYSQKKIGILK